MSLEARSRRTVSALALAGWMLATLDVAATAPATSPGSARLATAPSLKPGAGPPRPRPIAAPPRTTPAKRKTTASGPRRSPIEQARDARDLEDQGAYAQAADLLRALRGRLPLDGDLELALALDDARVGRVDSAAARLDSRILTAAAADSMPVTRRHEYGYERERLWGDGHFNGWNWYVLRARTEIAAHRGRWKGALADARRTVEARPLSGKDWQILAVCAGRAGEAEEARQAASQALLLDPTLPEAHYLAGLWAWKDGHRSQAAARLREAVALDSSYQEAALALIRAQLPGGQPDTLPTDLLTGIRRVALLTSPAGPKPEEFGQMDIPAQLVSSRDSSVIDPPKPGVNPLRLVLSVLVDENGRAVLNEVPWFSREQIDFRKITRIIASIPGWRFSPAQRLGRSHRVWVSLEYYLYP